MQITKSAFRELIRSECALTRGLPSEEWLDQEVETVKAHGSLELSGGFFLLYSPPCMGGAFEPDSEEMYELDFA
jgi:hypothetical protein